MLKIILMWLCFIPIPFINGILREAWYKKKIGEFWSNLVGVKFLSLSFLLYAYLFFGKYINTYTIGQMIKIGFIWLVMTVVFEFSIGLATKKNWSYMLADYNILKGRLWPIFLLVIFFSLPIVKFIINFFSI